MPNIMIYGERKYATTKFYFSFWTQIGSLEIQHQQAKEYYKRALSIKLNKLGPNHVDVAITYHKMGNLHEDLGEHQQAKEYYERALSIQLNRLGQDHVDVACTYHLLGDMQRVLDAQQLLANGSNDRP